MPETPERQDERIDKLGDSVARLNVSMGELNTLLRRHIGQQETLNARLFDLLDKHDHRIRNLEQWQAIKDATMPRKWLDANEVEGEIETMRGAVNRLDASVNRIGVTIAKWSGLAAGVVIVVELALKFSWAIF